MALALGAGQLLGAGYASARLSADDSFSLNAGSYSVAEAAGSAEITIVRGGSAAGAVSVHFATADGTAKAGSDYTAVSADIPFAPGDRSKTIQIPIANDSISEGDETVVLTLSSPSAGVLGYLSSATLTIVDDDKGFAFGSAIFNAAESDVVAYVTIRRLGLTTGSDSVQFSTADGTATAGSDYTAAVQTVTFSDGQSSQDVPVPIIDDKLVEDNETIQLTLSNPSAGTRLGERSATTLTIVDDDKRPAAPAKPSGKIVSAKLTKKRLSSSEAGLVKVVYSLYPKSKLFAYVLSYRSGSTWTIVRTVRKSGSFAGRYAITVRKLFGSKPIGSGSYRLKLSADKNSKTLSFRVT